MASTDVSDAHEAARTAPTRRWRCSAAIAGSSKRRAASCRDRATLPPIVARQLDKILLGGGRGAGHHPRRDQGARRRRVAPVVDDGRLHLHARRQAGQRQRHRRDAAEVARSAARAQGAWEASKEIGKPLKPGHRAAAEAAQPGGARDEALGLFRAPGRRLRHDRRRDDEDARRLRRRYQAALSQAARLGAREAGRALSRSRCRS